MACVADSPAFLHAYGEGVSFLATASCVADTLTPVTACMRLKAAFSDRLMLFESVEKGVRRGRYSCIALGADAVWTCRGNVASDSDTGAKSEGSEEIWRSFRAFCRRRTPAIPEGLPPVAFGVYGYLSYDMARHIERLPDANPDAIGADDAYFVRPKATLLFDNVNDALHLLYHVVPQEGTGGSEAREKAEKAIEGIWQALSRPSREEAPLLRRETRERPQEEAARFFRERVACHTAKDVFLASVERCKEYILAGDVFQVVPSQRFSAEMGADKAFAFYRRLRNLNPSPYSFYVEADGAALVGSSPETLVRVQDGRAVMRPIAGTRPRGSTPEEDDALAAELLRDEKELAEHLMLVDLCRNDVGRISEPGSVCVSEMNVIERYSRVMHIVSKVEGRLRPSLDAVDAIRAALPVGTVSGAPKVRAMEIIDELETERRSFYAGGVGYVSADGSMDLCIALRTAMLRNGRIYIQAGAGVVADSVPENEYRETLDKASALLGAAAETLGEE
jgi:anthranilate synthase component 1